MGHTGADIEALRLLLEAKPFAAKESVLLGLIQKAEAIHAQQRDMVKTAKELSDVFLLSVQQTRRTGAGATVVCRTVEASPIHTVSEVCEKLRPEVFDRPEATSPLQLLKDGDVLPQEATLQSLGVSAETPLAVEAPGCRFISVSVQTLTGKLIPLSIEAGATVDGVKAKIQDEEGIPSEQQRLTCAGRQLEGDRSLPDCGIADGAKLFLILRLRGGMHDEISGRQGFRVLADGFSFDDGSRQRISGGPTPDQMSRLEHARVDYLLDRLAQVQERTKNLSAEAESWLGLCGCAQQRSIRRHSD